MNFSRALFYCQERIKKMSMIDIEVVRKTAFEKPYTSAIGKEEPAADPKNCRNKCPYGHGRSFCFPCYAKIMAEHREAKAQSKKKA